MYAYTHMSDNWKGEAINMRQAGEQKELEGALRGLERKGKGENHMLTKNV